MVNSIDNSDEKYSQMLHGTHTKKVFIDMEHSLPLSEAPPCHLGNEADSAVPMDD